MKKTVSVIIPIRDSEKTISATLDCLTDQIFNNFKVLVVDDCSNSSACIDIVKSFNNSLCINIITLSKNVGVARAKNRGAMESGSDYVVFLDSDDFVKREWLAGLTAQLDNVDLVTCGYLINKVGAKGNIISSEKNIAPSVLDNKTRPKLLSGTFLIQRKLFLDIGGYDYRSEPMDHTELTLRLRNVVKKEIYDDRELFVYNSFFQDAFKRKEYAKKRLKSAEYLLNKHEKYYNYNPFEMATVLEIAGTDAVRFREYSVARALFKKSFFRHPSLRRFCKMMILSITPVFLKIMVDQREKRFMKLDK